MLALHCGRRASFVAGLEISFSPSPYAQFPPPSRLILVLPSAVIFGWFSSPLDLVFARFDSMKGATIPLGHKAFMPRP
jgi:hypothetical protein